MVKPLKSEAVRADRKSVGRIDGLDRDLALEILESALHNYRQASADILARGFIVPTTRLDSNGQPVTTDRPNPSVALQREALKTVLAIQKHLAWADANTPEESNALEDYLAAE